LVSSAGSHARSHLFLSRTLFEQSYEGGTTCDLTGKPRRVEANFFCDPEDSGSKVVSISETSTCSYVLKITTSLLCDHPLLAPRQPLVLPIICEPASYVIAAYE